MEMQGGVGKLTADSINMAYMDHGWTYVTLTDFFARGEMSQDSLVLCIFVGYSCKAGGIIDSPSPTGAGPSPNLKPFETHQSKSLESIAANQSQTNVTFKQFSTQR